MEKVQLYLRQSTGQRLDRIYYLYKAYGYIMEQVQLYLRQSTGQRLDKIYYLYKAYG